MSYSPAQQSRPPAPSPGPAPSSSAVPSAAFAPRAAQADLPKGGIYSSDGSFLDRFKSQRADEKEKNAAQEALRRKKEMDNRFVREAYHHLSQPSQSISQKKRGKRPATGSNSGSAEGTASPSSAVEEPPVKKTRAEEPAENAYQRALKNADNHSLKDTTGILRS